MSKSEGKASGACPGWDLDSSGPQATLCLAGLILNMLPPPGVLGSWVPPMVLESYKARLRGRGDFLIQLGGGL